VSTMMVWSSAVSTHGLPSGSSAAGPITPQQESGHPQQFRPRTTSYSGKMTRCNGRGEQPVCRVGPAFTGCGSRKGGGSPE
jgi:hypothetical protein